MKIKRSSKRRPKPKFLKPCENCRSIGELAVKAADVMEAEFREQQNLALSVLFQTMAADNAMLAALGNALETANGRYETECSLNRIDAKVISRYVSNRISLRAILDRERDGRLAPADVEKIRELIR